jgi:hypothetical protein
MRGRRVSAGQVCRGGDCIDSCSEPAVCPGGAACTNGTCGEPTGTGGSGGTGGSQGPSAGGVIQGGNGNGGGAAGVIATGGSGLGTGQGGDGDELGVAPKGNPGCACRAVPLRAPGPLSYPGIGLGLWLFGRRRARGRRAL